MVQQQLAVFNTLPETQMLFTMTIVCDTVLNEFSHIDQYFLVLTHCIRIKSLLADHTHYHPSS